MLRGRVLDYHPIDGVGFVRANDGKVYGFIDSQLIEKDRHIMENDAVWCDLQEGQIVRMWRI